MIVADESVQYEKVFNALSWVIENKITTFSETDFYKTLKDITSIINTELHEVLCKHNDEQTEKRNRFYCRYIIQKLLPLASQKKKAYEKMVNKDKDNVTDDVWQLYNNWLDLYDDLYALASYRSLAHLAMYLEFDDDEDNKVWKYTMDTTMGSFFYYAQAAILDFKFQNIIKQCQPGAGKSKSDCVFICYAFGINPNNTIMKMIGNPTISDEIFSNIVKMMCSKRFGKVFPRFGKYEGNKEKMFSEIKQNEGKFSIAGAKGRFLLANKDTSIDGARYNIQLYDDITRSKDMYNQKMHESDINRYNRTWELRKSNQNVIRIFTGTAYCLQDFLSYIKDFYSNGNELIKDLDTAKFKWSRFVKLSDDKKTVYILIPGLADLELGEEKCWATFPVKSPKSVLLRMYKKNPRDFMAMIQQTPMPPEAQAFDYTLLQQYAELPKDIVKNDCESFVMIDPAKKGKDNYCALFFKKSESTGYYYLVDAYYKQRVTSKIAVPVICERIAFHKIETIFYEENATDPDLMNKTIKENLKEMKWFNYRIESFYTTVNKEDKIRNNQDDIKLQIVFPMKGMYHFDSDMGRAMSDIVNYSFEEKNLHDDSIDCCAMFVERLNKKTGNEIFCFNMRF